MVENLQVWAELVKPRGCDEGFIPHHPFKLSLELLLPAGRLPPIRDRALDQRDQLSRMKKELAEARDILRLDLIDRLSITGEARSVLPAEREKPDPSRLRREGLCAPPSVALKEHFRLFECTLCRWSIAERAELLREDPPSELYLLRGDL